MARARIEALSRDEEDLIHVKSLELLETTGVRIRSDAVLDMLSGFGAEVDRRRQVALLPESVVIEALGKASREFTLCGREKDADVSMPSQGLPHLTTDGLTLYVKDHRSGEDRSASRDDFSQFARLADALDQIDLFWPIVTISDVPAHSHNLYELWESFRSCRLHVQCDCMSGEDARRQMNLASLVVGGDEELGKRPVFSCAIDPVAPLSFDGGPAEAQVAFAKAGVPVLCHSMSLSGLSSPVTVAGTLTNVHAENLASLVISQAARPGAPHIYGSSSTPIDMRTGSIDYTAPEGLLISASAGQLARRLGRPCTVSDWGAGAKGLGIRTSFTELAAHLGTVFAGSDIVPGVGGLDDAKGCSLAQMVIDSNLWDGFKAFMRDFTVSEETVALDVVREVGHGNSFLMHEHTARKFREELAIHDEDKLSLEATLSASMAPRAAAIADEVLRSHNPPALDRDVARDGEALLAEYSRGG
ncbi:MAG: trimethylamine methyltransferase family protein [Methanobacteriota archaeon]|nr:MAG: trimethylamine methyltransferase family protein [Euryarchaeota archaeon]